MEAPDSTYITKLLYELKRNLEGLHKRISEIELVRHLEDPVKLSDEERPSGLEIRIGAASELIENVKASLTTNLPQVRVAPLRTSATAQPNSSKREKFWNAYLKKIGRMLNETVDGQAGLGMGILKAAFYPWPKTDRKRLITNGVKETDAEFNDRQRALKRFWGPPFKVVPVHPLTFFYRLGPGDEIVEALEHSWRPKRETEAAFGTPSSSAIVSATPGMPIEEIQPLPYGTSTETLTLVTEYWSKEWYQIYINGKLMYEEADPSVHYFVAIGRTTVSRDPDKYGISVAEIFRHNEPIINRALTRVAEAVEIVVRKRLTIELPEGSTEGFETGEDNNLVPRTWKFKGDQAEALPAGAKIQDPFAGAENAFAALPFIELMLRLMGQHGVSPIFKGVPPGAVGSGYRDNSLYLMARSQFQYLVDSYELALAELVRWLESELVRSARQEIWIDDLSLSPKDIKEFPAVITVEVDPMLPQNIIAEGQFYDRMHARGHIPRRIVLESGMRLEQPEEIEYERMKEDLQELLKPSLYKDVLETVGILPPPEAGLVGPEGQPISSISLAPRGGPGGVQELMAALKGNGRSATGEAAQAAGGYTRAGQSRQPPEAAGAFPPGMRERA